MKYFLDNIKTILIIILLLMVVMLLRNCDSQNKAEQRAKELQRLSDRLQIAHHNDSIKLSTIYQQYQRDTAAAHERVLRAQQEKQATEKKMAATQATITRLAARLRAGYDQDSTTQYVQVDQRFVEDCDSLAGQSVTLTQQINTLRKDNDDLIDLMNYEVVLRDSLIEDGRTAIDKLRADFNAQTHLFNLAVKNAKQKGRLLGGLGLMGNEVNPLWGGGVVIAYQNKNGKQYQVGVNATLLGLMYEGKILITLIK